MNLDIFICRFQQNLLLKILFLTGKAKDRAVQHAHANRDGTTAISNSVSHNIEIACVNNQCNRHLLNVFLNSFGKMYQLYDMYLHISCLHFNFILLVP